MKALNDTLAFLLELAALVSLGYWGFTADPNPAVRIALGVGAPLVMIVVWGRWLAPRAARRLPMPWLVAVKLAVFGLAAAALAAAGAGVLAAVLAGLAAVHLVLAVALDRV